MVKFTLFCTKVIATTVVTLLFSSCHIRDIQIGDGIDGNGNVTRQTRNVEKNFSKIDVSRGLNVTIEQSNSYFVEVEADENLQSHIATKVEDDTLIITCDENIDQATSKKIHVKMPDLIDIETTSGSSVTTNGAFSGTEINIRTSSGSETIANLEFEKIKCQSTSGSNVTIRGKALRLNTSSSSGSSIDASELLANDVVSESTSGSTTNTHAILSLNGKASSGSSIHYNGSPKTVVKEESSGGSVSKE